MKTYEVTTADGKTYEVDVDDGASPSPSLKEQAPQIATDAARAAVMGPADATKKFFQTDPATMQREGGGALPIVGGALGGPIGAAVGEVARQATGAVLAPDTVPKTPLGVGASVIGAGVMQEPKILNAIPGVSQVGKMASELGSKAASKVGQGLAKGAQALSGGKAQDFVEAAKKGYTTYLAPSMEKASKKFGEAVRGLPGEDIAPSVRENIQSAITPESSAATKFLSDLGEKIDKGELITAKQALRAKQALDDVIDTVPQWQIKRRGKLFDIKKTFDDVMSSQSGELKEASNEYRAAVLKRDMTKFLPVNKHGQYSRLATMLASLAAGTGIGVHGSDAKKGGMGAAGYLLATSPLAMGGLATTGGSVAKGLMKLGENPATRQALLQILQKIQRKEKSNGD